MVARFILLSSEASDPDGPKKGNYPFAAVCGDKDKLLDRIVVPLLRSAIGDREGASRRVHRHLNRTPGVRQFIEIGDTISVGVLFGGCFHIAMRLKDGLGRRQFAQPSF
jgi:hypothetical protein